MRSRQDSGLTIPEILMAVVLVVTVVLGLQMLLPTISVKAGKAMGTQTLSNARQLWRATQAMTADDKLMENPMPCWPGDQGGSFALWASNLVARGYLTEPDLRRLLSAPGKLCVDVPTANTNALLVYATRSNSPADTVFLTTANFTNTPTGGQPLQKDAMPYGQSGFLVFRRAGDGTFFRRNQVGDTNVIGSYVPLCR